MAASPPIDELEARKRLAQARMEIHRAEMALYWDQITRPLRRAQDGLSTMISNPVFRWAAAGAGGWLLFTGRLRSLGRVAGWALPLVLPRARGFLARQAMTLAVRGFQGWRRR